MCFLRLYLTFCFIIVFTGGEIKNKGWWKNIIFYQIYPRSFMDSNNDGIGDLKGITNKLQHFVDSNIKGIWLSPINTSPMVDCGYDISNFLDIDKSYGTMDDFKELIKKANDNGIRVMMDFVPNHTSDQHEWFIKSVNGEEKYKDYYIWRKGRANNSQPPNNWLSIFGGSAWKYNKKRDLWYFHQFEYRQPDLNFNNPDVWTEMEEILRFWMSMGVHGFRVDAVNFIYEHDSLLDEPRSYIEGALKHEYKYLKHIYTFDDPRVYNLILKWRIVLDEWADSHNAEEKILMIEAYSDLPKTMRYYKQGAQMPFNFNFIVNINNKSKPSAFKKIIDDWMENMPKDETANWVTSNHDHKRAPSKFPERPDLLQVLVLILPGTACVYYGEEILMHNNELSWEDTKDPRALNAGPERYHLITRDGCRSPFQWDDTINAGFSKAKKTWLPIHKNFKNLNLNRQKNEPESHYKLFQTLSRLKTTSKVLQNGNLITDTLNNNQILVVARQFSNEGIVLAVNFSNDKPQNVNLCHYLPGAEKATVIISSVGSSIRWGTSVSIKNIILPPKTLLVITSNIKS